MRDSLDWYIWTTELKKENEDENRRLKEALKEPSESEKLRFYEINPGVLEEKINSKVDKTTVFNVPHPRPEHKIIVKSARKCPFIEAAELHMKLDWPNHQMIYLDHDNLEAHYYKW